MANDQLIEVVQTVVVAEQVVDDPDSKEESDNDPIHDFSWIFVVLEQKHDDHIGPEEGHVEGTLTRSSEVEKAISVGLDLLNVPKRPSTLETDLHEGNEVDSKARE